MRNINSRRYFDSAKKLFSIDEITPAFFIKYADRSSIYDHDNNSLVDYFLCNGSLILGHAEPHAVLAAKKAAERGIIFPAYFKEEIEIADYVSKIIPSIESVKFFASYEEIILKAVRFSQKENRKIIFKFSKNHDFLNEYFQKEFIISSKFNDFDFTKRLLDENKDRIACILIEVIDVEEGINYVNPEFFSFLKNFTHTNDIALIVDEVNSAFRSKIGCFHSDFNIAADIVILGNILGAGFPLYCLGASVSVIKQIKNEDFTSAVFLKAAYAQLKALNNSFYVKLNKKIQNFAADLNHFFEENSIDTKITYYGNMLHINLELSRYIKLAKYLLNKKIYFSQKTAGLFYISGVHSHKELDVLTLELKKYFTRYERV